MRNFPNETRKTRTTRTRQTTIIQPHHPPTTTSSPPSRRAGAGPKRASAERPQERVTRVDRAAARRGRPSRAERFLAARCAQASATGSVTKTSARTTRSPGGKRSMRPQRRRLASRYRGPGPRPHVSRSRVRRRPCPSRGLGRRRARRQSSAARCRSRPRPSMPALRRDETRSNPRRRPELRRQRVMRYAIAATAVGDSVDVQPVDAIDAAYGMAADCRALHRCGCRDDGRGLACSYACPSRRLRLAAGSSRVTAGQMNAELSLARCALGPHCKARCVRLLQVSTGLAARPERGAASMLRLDIRVANPMNKAYRVHAVAPASCSATHEQWRAPLPHPSPCPQAGTASAIRPGRSARVAGSAARCAQAGQLCRERGAGAKTMADVRREAVSCED